MRALLISEQGTGFEHQRDAMRSLAAGMTKHGIEARVRSAPASPHADDNFFVSWGDPRPAQTHGVPHLILEAGYINGDGDSYNANRLRFISTSWNRRHGLSDWIWPDEPDGERWDALGIELRPWKQDGKYVLLLEQHYGDRAAPHVDEFRRDIVAECERR